MMQFTHTWEKVLSGEKTQTRRIVKPGDTVLNYWRNPVQDDYYYPGFVDPIGVIRRNGRDLWRVTGNYAVCPGRGKASIAHILIRSIRREDVRNISDEDVTAEGFETASDFFITWCKMHDKGQMLPIIPDYFTGAIVWQGVRSELQQRPAERYQAWVLTFELVK